MDEWELIVVNDGSTDGTDESVRPYLSDTRIRLLSQSNQGVAEARNRAIREARGAWIAFLDSDDLWHPFKLEKQLRRLADERAKMCCTGREIFVHSPGDLPPETQRAVSDEIRIEDLLRGNFLTLSSVVIERKMLARLGGFDPDLFGTEDWDLWIRALAFTRIVCIDEPLTLYREHPAGISKNLRRHLKEKYKVLRKHVETNEMLPAALRREIMWKYRLQSGMFAVKESERGEALACCAYCLARRPFRRATLALVFRTAEMLLFAAVRPARSNGCV